MTIASHLFILTCLSFACGREVPAVVPSTGTQLAGNRIVGGQIVENRADFPYQASLRFTPQNFHFCGASIIDSKHLLTAAHCVVDDEGVVTEASVLMVVVGDLKTNQKSDTTVVRNISHVFTHSRYNRIVPRENDIAVLRVSEDFGDWTANVKSISLTSTRPADETSCIISGWGATEHSDSSDDLRFVSVPIVPDSQCEDEYPLHITNGMVCAGYPAGGKDSCQGDSGGPLVCNKLLAGIVSWGVGCGEAGYSGVYTDVSEYRPWIDEQIARSSAITSSSGAFAIFIAIICFTY